jgi:hypothetical protein
LFDHLSLLFVSIRATIDESFRSLRKFFAVPGQCSAGFKTCCIADFQIGRVRESAQLAGLETRGTAELEVCATLAAASSLPVRSWLKIAALILVFCVTSCATISRHEFNEPATEWQTKTGQLMYRSPKRTLIGDAIVRFSKTGNFELTVSKGPGITLLSLRQDAAFAEVKGAFARQGWSGPVAKAPQQLRGWLGLRDQFTRAPNQKVVQYAAGNETFLFRF